jgi:hypothetical protein
MVDRVSDRGYGPASCCAASHPAVTHQANRNAGGTCFLQGALRQDVENAILLLWRRESCGW